MNRKQKIILWIILIDISVLILLILISTSYSVPPNINNFISTTTDESILTSTTKNVEQSSASIITTAKQDTTTKINDNITTDNFKYNAYYYGWSDDDSTDFTRRNCLFIYDTNQSRVNGEIELIYFEKYKKIQKITNDIDNCFLEDKNSVIINAIIVDGVRYDKIIKK